MNEDFFTLLLVILIFIVFGMLVGIIMKPLYHIHGPKSSDVSNKIFKYGKLKRCFMLKPRKMKCPITNRFFSKKRP